MRHNERGIALVIALFLMATLSALAVSMMFLAQTETAASRNYRTMSQARYAAEAGVHAMANYLMSPTYSAVAPTTVPATGYDATKQPVTCPTGTAGCAHTTGGTCDGSTVANAVNTGCIVIGYSAATSNNPAGLSNAGATGTLAMNASGTTTNAAMGTATYGAAAILVSMKQITVYGGGNAVVQTWQIIADGTVPPSTAAIVEVSSTIEQEVGFATSYAVFATNPLCGAITIGGSATTDSYNSATLSSGSAWSGGSTGSGTPNTTPTGGGVGTNGNLNVGGSVNIGGTLSTPRTGAGACSNSSVDAITGTGSWTYAGTHQLSQAVIYPTPTIPSGIPSSPTPPVKIQASDTSNQCATNLGAPTSGWGCSVNAITHQVTIYPTGSGTTTLTLPDVTVGSNTNLVIAGVTGAPSGTTTSVTLNVNSFSIGSNATISLADGSGSFSRANVLMNIGGQNLGSTKPLDLSGGGQVNTEIPAGLNSVSVNSGFDSSRIQILYAGPGEIDLVGTNDIAATVYAPNAFVKTVGNGSMYGSILGSTFQDNGGAKINYDSSLSIKFSTIGNWMLTSFSWKKY